MHHSKAHHSGYRAPVQFQREQVHAAVEPYGFLPVYEHQIDEFHQLADALIDGEIADPAALWRVESWSGRALLIRRQDGVANAILASIPLTSAGVDALLSGRFGFANAERDWVCGPHEPASALLSWGMAGRSARDQTAALRCLLAAWYSIYSDVRVYARARTLEGETLMARLGFERVGLPGDGSALFGSTGYPLELARRLSMRGIEPPTNPITESAL
jgi:hypothetical protein